MLIYEKWFVFRVKPILGSHLDCGSLIDDRCFTGLVLEQLTDTTALKSHESYSSTNVKIQHNLSPLLFKINQLFPTVCQNLETRAIQHQ